MKKTLAHSIDWAKSNILYSGVIAAIVIIAIIYIVTKTGGSSVLETKSVTLGDIHETVSVTGKVTPVTRVNLGFDRGGILASKNVKVGVIVKAGENLGALDTGEVYANFTGAQANLLSEQAKLDELTKGTRPEQLELSKSKATNAQASHEDAVQNLAIALRDAYIRVEDAGRNKTDTFFLYPESTNPTINVRTENSTVANDVNDKRQRFNEMLSIWKNQLGSLSTSTDLSAAVVTAQKNILQAKTYFDVLSSIVNGLTIGNSGLPQSTIDSYRALVTSGQSEIVAGATNLANAVSNMTAARSTLLVSQNELTLSQSGSTAEAIKAQEGKVAQAQATVLANESLLAKSAIISPIDGIVSVADPEVGEFITAGKVVFSVLTVDAYKIEVQVPEADIAKIAVGNAAKITLDAYGSDVVFTGKVTLIDPAETIVEGVPTYKVTLQFDGKDSRVRSGMTANIIVVTAEKMGVPSLPTGAIIDRGAQKYVRVPAGASYVEKEIKTGLKGSNGVTEILEGLTLGDNVVLFVK